MKVKDTLIHPEDPGNLIYWTKKWGVSVKQLNNAILDTGSVNSLQIKEYLKKNSWHYLYVTGLFKLLHFKL